MPMPVLTAVVLAATAVLASPLPAVVERAVTPVVSGTPKKLGELTVFYPPVNRDSCGSSRFGVNELWTCRDTQIEGSTGPFGTLVSSSAGWTHFNSDGTPQLNWSDWSRSGPFFPIPADMCSSNSGDCSDGTRYPMWEDSPVLTTVAYPNGYAQGYTWIVNHHISGLSDIDPTPGGALYRVVYNPTVPDTTGVGLPTATLVAEHFYPQGQVVFGSFGNIVVASEGGSFGTAYLYGILKDGSTALAKVDVLNIENRGSYAYYVNGAWTSTPPSPTSSGAKIPNAGVGGGGSGQGNFYYSPKWSSYVWIGGGPYPTATFYISTAPRPEGPWTTPTQFFQGPAGNSTTLPAYSCQAHPGLTDGSGKDIYITYTRVDKNPSGQDIYYHPLYRVVWA